MEKRKEFWSSNQSSLNAGPKFVMSEGKSVDEQRVYHVKAFWLVFILRILIKSELWLVNECQCWENLITLAHSA